jgi:hypothetical protein
MAELHDLVDTVAGGAAMCERLAAEHELCVQLAPRIRLYGLRHLRDEAAAADLVQEARTAPAHCSFHWARRAPGIPTEPGADFS